MTNQKNNAHGFLQDDKGNKSSDRIIKIGASVLLFIGVVVLFTMSLFLKTADPATCITLLLIIATIAGVSNIGTMIGKIKGK